MMELTEVFRSSFAVAFSRMHVFDNAIAMPALVFDQSQSEEVRWLSWRSWEMRRRTGFACFLSDGLFSFKFLENASDHV